MTTEQNRIKVRVLGPGPLLLEEAVNEKLQELESHAKLTGSSGAPMSQDPIYLNKVGITLHGS